MPQLSIWCGARGAWPRHEECPGHHKSNEEMPCECECGHPHMKSRVCLCGKTHTPEDKVATVEGHGQSDWCTDRMHDVCPGHQISNVQLVCECDCDHPHLKKEDTMPKAPVPVDTMPDELKKYTEDPQQFEWWLSSRPTKDLTPEPTFSSNIGMLLLFEFLTDRIKEPGRLLNLGVTPSTIGAYYKKPPLNDAIRQLLPDWTLDMVYSLDSLPGGQIVYWKAHKALVEWLAVWNAEDKDSA